MKIELSQSGGFAGETIRLKELSADNIPGAAKEQLDALLKETNFFSAKKAVGDPDKMGADFLTYHLKITGSKEGSNEVSFSDPVSDSSFSKLLSLIKSL